MGSHTFTWPHAASEVFVTGTFDNWGKTVQLQRHGEAFHKTVDLPAEKTYYKFVVDGNWTTDHTIAQETDASGNVNNVLSVSDLKAAPSSHSFLSSAAPLASTAALAGSQPLTGKREMDDMPGVVASRQPAVRNQSFKPDVPGAFPQTPANELQQFFAKPLPATEGAGNPIKLAPGEPVPDPSTFTSNTINSTVRSDPSLKRNVEDEEQAFGVNPIPATEGAGNPIKLAPGEPVPHPSTFTSNTVDSTVRSDPSLRSSAEDDEQAFGVAPIPATSGIGNPIKLAPGEPVPHPSTLTRNTVDSTVSDMRSESGAPVLPPVLTPHSEAEAAGASMFDLPSVGGNMIPESSLPMGASTGAGARAGAYSFEEPNFTTSSVGPESTSATLAGAVPIRERGVPEVVTESQDRAHVGREAAGNVSAVEEKSALEEELKATVPEARATSEAFGTGNASEVPSAVTTSQHRADVDPEASADPTAVSGKSAMEDELKQTVPEEPATSSSGMFGSSERGIIGAIAGGAAVAGAAVATGAYAARDKVADYTKDTPVADNAYAARDRVAEYAQGTPATTSSTTSAIGNGVPAPVMDSQLRAHAEPEASSSVEAVRDKSAMEAELKRTVPEEPSTTESGMFGKSEGGISGTLAAGAAALTGTAAAGAYALRDKATEYTQGTSTTSTPAYTGVPDPVRESQMEAHAAPEASAEPGVVVEKSAMEQELKRTVPEEPPTSESGAFGRSEGGVAGTIAAGTAAVTGAAAATAYATRDKATEYTQSTPTTYNTAGSAVPAPVRESQMEAHAAPEASAEPEVVREKSAMEKELLNSVPKEPATTESGVFGKSEGGVVGTIAAGTAAVTGAAAATAYAARDKAAEYTQSSTMSSTTGSGVPAPVRDSQREAHAAPEASAEPEVVREKSAMEKELMSSVQKEPATSESGVFGKSEGGIAGTVAAGTAAMTGAAAAGAYAARDKAAESTGRNMHTFLPPSVQSAIDNMNHHGVSNTTTPAIAAAGTSATTAPIAAVPEIVSESQREAHFAPEAAAEPEVVAEKSVMEKELLRKVPTSDEAGEPAPTESTAFTETAPISTGAATSSFPTESAAFVETGAVSTGAATSSFPTSQADMTPAFPEERIAERETDASTTATPAKNIAERATAPSSAFAASETADPVSAFPTSETVDRTSAFPTSETADRTSALPSSETAATKTADPATDAAVASTGLNAPASSQAQSDTLAAKPLNDSRDVSPMSRPGTHTQTEPTVTTGTATEKIDAPKASTPTQTPQATPVKGKRASSFFRGTPESNRTSMSHVSEASNSEAKPKKRSFLSKLKEKFKN